MTECACDELDFFGKEIHSHRDWTPVCPAHNEGGEDVAFVVFGKDDLLPGGELEFFLSPFEESDAEGDADERAENELIEDDFFGNHEWSAVITKKYDLKFEHEIDKEGYEHINS